MVPLAALWGRVQNQGQIAALSERGGIAMPIYEYECDRCHRRSSVLTLRVSEKVKPVCSHCGATAMHRLMSRFAMPKSEEARMDALANPAALSGLDENDPKSVARL